MTLLRNAEGVGVASLFKVKLLENTQIYYRVFYTHFAIALS